METAARPKARYDTSRMLADMALRGWIARDLARVAGVSDMTVSRFLKGHTQTARTAERLARALGHAPKRYFVGVAA